MSGVRVGWTLRQLCEQFPNDLDKLLVVKDPDQRGYAFTVDPAYDLTVISSEYADTEFVMLEVNDQDLVRVEGLEANGG